MSFFKTMVTAFKGNKHKIEENKKNKDKPKASIDNLVVDGLVTFGFLPEQEQLNESTFTITSKQSFELSGGRNIEYAELDNGELFIRKEGNKLEILKEFKDNEAFLKAVNFDELNEVLYIDEHEFDLDENGVAYITENQNMFTLESDFDWLKKSKYRTIEDIMSAKLNNETIRFIRAKSSDGSNYINIFYKEGGETFICGSILIDLSDVSVL